MNDVEEVLRDALTARAAVVTPDPEAYAAVVARRHRRRYVRLARPAGVVAAAATVVGVLAVAGVVAPHGTVTPTAGAPAYVVTIRHDQAVVLDPRRLGAAPVATTPEGYGVIAIAAVGDGRTFYAAAQQKDVRCSATLFRLDSGGAVTKAGTLPYLPWSIAVTRDGKRLAYSPNEGGCGAQPIRVRDLTTGRERAWVGDNRTLLQKLTWSPDGRYLAWEENAYQISRLDTVKDRTLPPLDETKWERALNSLGSDPDPDRLRCGLRSPAYLPTGELVVMARCHDKWGATVPLRIVTWDPETYAIGRVLFTMPKRNPHWLAFDASGDHAYLAVDDDENGGGGLQVYLWNAGRPPRRLSDRDARAVLDFAARPLADHAAW